LEEARLRLEDSLREHPHDAASIVLLGEICLRSDSCRDRIPVLARGAAFFGEGPASRALLAEFDSAREGP
jgi:cytochrome c-type biogenesis protein CcmH/NrfG